MGPTSPNVSHKRQQNSRAGRAAVETAVFLRTCCQNPAFLVHRVEKSCIRVRVAAAAYRAGCGTVASSFIERGDCGYGGLCRVCCVGLVELVTCGRRQKGVGSSGQRGRSRKGQQGEERGGGEAAGGGMVPAEQEGAGERVPI